MSGERLTDKKLEYASYVKPIWTFFWLGVLFMPYNPKLLLSTVYLLTISKFLKVGNL